MNKLTVTISCILEKFLIFLMAAIVIDVSWQIATRFIFSHPSSFTEELAGFLLMWIGLLGGSYAYYKKAHLGIDIFTCRLQHTRKAISEFIIALIVFLFSFFILLLGGLRLVTITFTLQQISPSLKISMGYIYLVLPLTGILMMYYATTFMYDAFITIKNQSSSTSEH